MIACGDLDPITLETFPPNTPEEDKIINRLSRRKAPSSFRTLRVVDGPQEQPKWLRNNPHPFYLELWNKNPSLYWQQYQKDKAAGKLRYLKKSKKGEREWIDFSEIKFKPKDELRAERIAKREIKAKDKRKAKRLKERRRAERAKLKRRLNPEAQSCSDSEDDNPYEEGYSPKASKEAKQKAKAQVEEQLQHDLEMGEGEREEAMDAFIKRTDYNKAPVETSSITS